MGDDEEDLGGHGHTPMDAQSSVEDALSVASGHYTAGSVSGRSDGGVDTSVIALSEVGYVADGDVGNVFRCAQTHCTCLLVCFFFLLRL